MTVYGTRRLGSALLRYRAGEGGDRQSDPVYRVGSLFAAERPAQLAELREARDAVSELHASCKARGLLAEARDLFQLRRELNALVLGAR